MSLLGGQISGCCFSFFASDCSRQPVGAVTTYQKKIQIT